MNAPVNSPGTNNESKRYSYQDQSVKDAYADSGGKSKNGSGWASLDSALALANHLDGVHDGTLTDKEITELKSDYDALNEDLKDLQAIKTQYGAESEQFKSKKSEVDKSAQAFNQKVEIERGDTESTSARQTEEQSKQFAVQKNKELEEASGITGEHDIF